MRTIVFISAALFLAFCSLYAADVLAYGYDLQYGMQSPTEGSGGIVSRVISALMGLVLGAFLSDKFRKLRWFLFMIAGVLFCAGLLIAPVTGQITSFGVGFFVAYTALSSKQKNKLRNIMKRFAHFRQTVFGSSSWATLEHLQAHNLTGDKGLFLGMYRHRDEDSTLRDVPLHYAGDRHLMTVAAARGGKGVSSVIPNLLTYEGSVLAIDIKGELSLMTAARRGQGDEALGIEGMGQDVFVVDPWGITGMESACFNPLDWLDPQDTDINENVMILWDSIIVQRGAKEPFWDDEAKALGMGITLHVATAPQEQRNRTLARVRDIITAGQSEFASVLSDMLDSPNPIVRSTATR